MKKHALYRLGIQVKDPATWPLPEPQRVERFYSTGEHIIGPQIQFLKIDWNVRGVTSWTRRAAVLFAVEFAGEHRLGSFPTLNRPPPPLEIVQIFINYIKHLKDLYRGGVGTKHNLMKQRWRRRRRRSQVRC